MRQVLMGRGFRTWAGVVLAPRCTPVTSLQGICGLGPTPDTKGPNLPLGLAHPRAQKAHSSGSRLSWLRATETRLVAMVTPLAMAGGLWVGYLCLCYSVGALGVWPGEPLWVQWGG